MKKILICILMMACSLAVSAQNNRAFKKGYQGDIEIGNYAVFGKGKFGGLIQATTTHGYRFGNGMFIGAGFGVGYDLAVDDGPVIPIYMDAKYNFLDAAVSPFASARTGIRFCGASRYEMFQPFIAIAGGIDVGRFSVKLGYDYGNVRAMTYVQYNRVQELYKPSQLFCSFAFKF